MWSENRQLAVIALIAAICAGFGFSFHYELLTIIFVLESGVATMLALL
jgi:hypothetical protein